MRFDYDGNSTEPSPADDECPFCHLHPMNGADTSLTCSMNLLEPLDLPGNANDSGTATRLFPATTPNIASGSTAMDVSSLPMRLHRRRLAHGPTLMSSLHIHASPDTLLLSTPPPVPLNIVTRAAASILLPDTLASVMSVFNPKQEISDQLPTRLVKQGMRPTSGRRQPVRLNAAGTGPPNTTQWREVKRQR